MYSRIIVAFQLTRTQIETDRISATATVSAPTLFKMSFVPGFGFGHESLGQATATAETGE